MPLPFLGSIPRAHSHDMSRPREMVHVYCTTDLAEAFTPNRPLGVMADVIALRGEVRPLVSELVEREIPVVPALETLRTELGGRPYLKERFTYADINAAAMLQLVRPADDRYMPLGPGTREVWTHATLGSRFPDLLEWRDGLYAKHRRP